MADPRPAASLILLRDRHPGPEVLLQRRGGGAAFMAGAHVFPGGVVEEVDHAVPAEAVDDPHGTLLAHRVAAIREAWEEAGVLLAEGEPPDAEVMLHRLRDRTDATDWRPWLVEHRLSLRVSSLQPVARWITPETEPRRFDTYFFLSGWDGAGDTAHDPGEMASLEWIRPGEALAAAARGDLHLLPPTWVNLEALAGFDSVGAALAAPKDPNLDRPIQPTLEGGPDGSVWARHETFGRLRVR